MEGIFILTGAAALIFGIVIWSFISYHHNLKIGKGLIDDVAPTTETYATILEKNVVMEQTGSSKMPSHHISYLVRFRFDNGKENTLCVPQEIFDDLPVGARDILITQDQSFLDFGGRCGEAPTDDMESKDL